MVNDNRLQLRASTDLTEWLEDRSDRTHLGHSPDIQARTELETWRLVLQAELSRIRITRRQACCLVDVMAGDLLHTGVPTSFPRLAAEAYDAFNIARSGPASELSSYGAKWGIEEQPLLEWLGRLSPAAGLALEDALSRWWANPESSDSVESFAAVGLTVIDD